jgi:Cu/Ag efflux protein CusF
MIKTIIFTKAFKQNLSKFNRVEVVESPMVTSEVLIEKESEEKSEEIVQPPKFKEFDNQVQQVNIVKKDYGSLEYEPVLRKFRVRPDLSEEIKVVKQGVNDEIEKVNNLLRDEENRFNKVKEQQDKLMRFVNETDLRNKDNIS